MSFESSSPWLVALLASAAIVGAAWRAGSLSGSGAAAALVLGTVSLMRAWGWGAFLVLWFVLASVLSRVGRTGKAARVSGVVEKGDRRDGWQVCANGGLFAIGALATMGPYASSLSPTALHALSVAAAAALVASGADTWATELGTLGGARPWSLREWKHVAIGTSGAVTVFGTLASAVGALALAGLAGALKIIPPDGIVLVAVAGFGGAAADSIVGAWVQSRRWCTRCQRSTEQRVHDCGAGTVANGGLRSVTNDAVNALCTACGALIAIGLLQVW